MKSLFIIFSFILLHIDSSSQKYVTIKMKYPKELGDSLKCSLLQINDFFYKKDYLLSLNDSITYFANDKDTNITICRYQVLKDTSFAFIAEGWAKHEILLTPNDTLNIATTLLNKTKWPYQVVPAKWKYVYNFIGKNKEINSFSDSIFLLFNIDMYNNPTPSTQSSNIDSVFRSIMYNYEMCYLYIKDYCFRYNLPNNIFEREKNNLISHFVLTLSSYRTKCKECFKKYFFNNNTLLGNELITKTKTNSALFFENYLWRAMVHAYLIANYYNEYSDINEETKFINKYENINKFIINDSIKEYLSAEHLYIFAKYHYSKSDSLNIEFKKKYPNSIYSLKIDSFIISNSYTNLDSVLKLNELKDLDDNSLSILKVLKNLQRPVYIDFWATWCKPCLTEMKYSHMLEVLYKNQIDFVYISLDSNKNDWIEYVKSNKLSDNQYWLQENFSSQMIKRFGIASIPHYIIFDKYGKLISANAPRPYKQGDELKKILNKLINK